ncbi:MAG: hypothetical protein ACJ78Q_07370 [Chloroflexia bacterium]
MLYQEKGSPSTYAGMSNGAIRPTISYSVNGVQHTAQRFLDRPWVRDVQPGTELHLLVDPDKSTILYVVGIAAQPAQSPEPNPPRHFWARRS